MRIKSLLFVCCFSLMGTLFAQSHYIYPHPGSQNENTAAAKSAMYPGYCEIELINKSFENVTVYGTLEEGDRMEPFNIYVYDAPYYIRLFYNRYCHDGMYLNIYTFSNRLVYSGYTYNGSTITVVPVFGNQVKAEITKK